MKKKTKSFYNSCTSDEDADVNSKTEKGVTALMFASKKHRTEIAQLLKQAGAKE